MRRPDVFTLDYSHPLAQGLVLASMLRRGRDESLRNLHGAIVNIPDSRWYVDPEIGRHAVLFSGGTDHIAHPYKLSAVDFGNGGTYAAWLNFGTPSTDEYNGSWNAPRVYLGKQGQTHVFGWGSSFGYGIANAATPNVWGHLALTNNGSSSIFYVNGIQVGTALQTFSGVQANNFGVGLCIGVGRPMRGPVSDTVLYNRALSPAEIAILADRTDPMLGGLIVEERPVLYFDMGGSTTDALTASDLVVSSPVLGAPALGQAHALTATGITTSAPVLGSPALGQVHGLTANGLTTGAPVLGSPALAENLENVDILFASDLVTGSPVLGSPALTQIHALIANDLTVGAPILGTPALSDGTVQPSKRRGGGAWIPTPPKQKAKPKKPQLIDAPTKSEDERIIDIGKAFDTQPPVNPALEVFDTPDDPSAIVVSQPEQPAPTPLVISKPEDVFDDDARRIVAQIMSDVPGMMQEEARRVAAMRMRDEDEVASLIMIFASV